jgi:hypothetical protein
VKTRQQDNTSKNFRLTLTTRPGNTIVTALLHAGIKIGTMTVLTVHGRKSGQSDKGDVFLDTSSTGSPMAIAPPWSM